MQIPLGGKFWTFFFFFDFWKCQGKGWNSDANNPLVDWLRDLRDLADIMHVFTMTCLHSNTKYTSHYFWGYTMYIIKPNIAACPLPA